MGFLEALQIVFIVLKLCHVIDWHWALVFIPAYVSFVLYVLVVIVKIKEDL